MLARRLQTLGYSSGARKILDSAISKEIAKAESFDGAEEELYDLYSFIIRLCELNDDYEKATLYRQKQKSLLNLGFTPKE